MYLFASLLSLFLTAIHIYCVESRDNGSVRLVNGELSSEGRVEVYINGQWGTVCDEDWDLQDGKVVCVQLKYKNVSEVKGGAFFGEGSGPIHFFGLNCRGNETNLTQCDTYKRKDCQHIHDAGVRCYPPDENSGLSATIIGIIILVPFLILIVLITMTICTMIYFTLKFDRASFEERENQWRRGRFGRGLSLREQTMLATKGRKGFFKSSRRRSDLPNMSGSSSFVDRPNIPRAALGEGLAHPWQTTDEVETDIDEDDERFAHDTPQRMNVRQTMEAFNPVLLNNNTDRSTEDTKRSEKASVPAWYRRGRDPAEDTSDDSDFNPYENEPNIG